MRAAAVVQVLQDLFYVLLHVLFYLRSLLKLAVCFHSWHASTNIEKRKMQVTNHWLERVHVYPLARVVSQSFYMHAGFIPFLYSAPRHVGRLCSWIKIFGARATTVFFWGGTLTRNADIKSNEVELRNDNVVRKWSEDHRRANVVKYSQTESEQFANVDLGLLSLIGGPRPWGSWERAYLAYWVTLHRLAYSIVKGGWSYKKLLSVFDACIFLPSQLSVLLCTESVSWSQWWYSLYTWNCSIVRCCSILWVYVVGNRRIRAWTCTRHCFQYTVYTNSDIIIPLLYDVASFCFTCNQNVVQETL